MWSWETNIHKDLDVKTPNIDSTISLFHETSSSNSKNAIIHCSNFSPRVLVYPLESGKLLSATFLEVKEEEVSVNTPSFLFPLLPEVEEKDILKRSHIHNVHSFSLNN